MEQKPTSIDLVGVSPERIGTGSRIEQIARILNMSPEEFGKKAAPYGPYHPDAGQIAAFAESEHGKTIISCFATIKDTEHRQRVVDFVVSMSIAGT